jgi:aminomethyltransferase
VARRCITVFVHGEASPKGWNPDLGANVGLGSVPAAKLQAATDVPLDDSVYDADLDLEFEVNLPDEYAEVPGEPVYATLATVPFEESVDPSARERAKIHAGDDRDEKDDRDDSASQPSRECE